MSLNITGQKFFLTKFMYSSLYICILLFTLSAMPVAFAGDVEKAQQLLRDASNYYNNRDYKNAESTFNQLLLLDIELHENFYFFFGKTLYHNKKYDRAVEYLGHFVSTVGNDNVFYTESKKLLYEARKMQAELHPDIRKEKESAKSKNQQKSQPWIPLMITISAGDFTMGSRAGHPDQTPPHKMRIDKSFKISKFEITWSQYEKFVEETGRDMPEDESWGRGNFPVINVSYLDAVAYTEWLSEKTGRRFRLPTEAEWEYVTRTGVKKQLGFSEIMGLGDANCDGCRYFWESDKTTEVGSYEPNSYGIHDLLGNVWEWTCSIYTPKGYQGTQKICVDPQSIEGETMALRGGSWDSSNQILRSYVRYNDFPTAKSNQYGIRIVEEIE